MNFTFAKDFFAAEGETSTNVSCSFVFRSLRESGADSNDPNQRTAIVNSTLP